METNSYNLYATILTLITMLIAIVSMYVSISQAAITQDVANKLLNIEMFRHKKEIAPSLSMAYTVVPDIPQSGKLVWIRLESNNLGKVTIQNIKFSGHIETIRLVGDHQPIEFPFPLLGNSIKQFVVTIRPSTYNETYIRLQAHELGIDFNESYYKTFCDIMEDTFVTIHLHDENSNPYRVFLNYVKETKSYEGKIQEIEKMI